MDIMTTLFDQDEVTRRYQANLEKENIAKGASDERKSQIKGMLTRGKTAKEIADFCGYPLKLVKAVQKSLQPV